MDIKNLEFEFEMLLMDLKRGRTFNLQLAAELGKTLLERNKELEGTIKQQQTTIDEQALEIEYLTKQTIALHEVNDTRLRCYENLELSILDTEQANQRLATENVNLKKQIKTLSTNAETLESRCEELSRQHDDITKQFRSEKRRNERLVQEQNKQDELNRIELKKPNFNISVSSEENYSLGYQLAPENISFPFLPSHRSSLTSSSLVEDSDQLDGLNKFSDDKNDEFLRTLDELEVKRRECIAEQQRVTELEEQLRALIQDNNALQNRLAHTTAQEEIKSMHEELSTLDDVRCGKMCVRCLRIANDDEEDDEKLPDDNFSVAETEDGDNQSLNSTDTTPKTYHTSVTFQQTTLDVSLRGPSPSPNPYRELVEKYEALLEVKRQPMRSRQATLQDELMSSDFSSINTKDTDDERLRSIKNQNEMRPRKICLRTPTDFSEAETSSSGFSDETSNKSTQTDENFLCTIADGEEKFSIYDDALPIDSRFRNRPEYRELFKEIFAILKRAAENKDEGEKLPLLDDNNPCFKAPPVTPAVETLPAFPDETESVISSIVSEQSVAMSECVTKREKQSIIGTVKKHIEKNGQENKPPSGKIVLPDGRVLTPLKREPLEYLAVSVNVRKKNKKKPRGTPPSESPIVSSPSRYSSGKKRRDFKPMPSSFLSSTSSNVGEWNGTTMTVYNKSMQSTPTSSPNSSFQASPMMTKTPECRRKASQDLHKLRKLELSYAEVLRRADTKNNQGHGHNYNHNYNQTHNYFRK